MGPQPLADADIELGRRHGVGHVAHVRGADPLGQIPGDVVLADEVHVLLHSLHQSPVVSHILDQVAVLGDLHLHSGAHGRTLGAPVNDSDHFL